MNTSSDLHEIFLSWEVCGYVNWILYWIAFVWTMLRSTTSIQSAINSSFCCVFEQPKSFNFRKYLPMLKDHYDTKRDMMMIDAKNADAKREREHADEKRKHELDEMMQRLREERAILVEQEKKKSKTGFWGNLWNVVTAPVAVPASAIGSVISGEDFIDVYKNLSM